MNKEGLEVFVEAVQAFFDKQDDGEASVGTPYLIQNINDELLELTGVISISGNHRGTVFFTANKLMASRLLQSMGVVTSLLDKQLDLVGEVCNIISGNVRREFGENFMISTPILMQGKADDLKVSKVRDIYVVPIIWKEIRANLIINLNEEK